MDDSDKHASFCFPFCYIHCVGNKTGKQEHNYCNYKNSAELMTCINIASVFTVCRACFHKHCFVEKKCPKCARIQSRKKRLEGSTKSDIWLIILYGSATLPLPQCHIKHCCTWNVKEFLYSYTPLSVYQNNIFITKIREFKLTLLNIWIPLKHFIFPVEIKLILWERFFTSSHNILLCKTISTCLFAWMYECGLSVSNTDGLHHQLNQQWWKKQSAQIPSTVVPESLNVNVFFLILF